MKQNKYKYQVAFGMKLGNPSINLLHGGRRRNLATNEASVAQKYLGGRHRLS